MLVNRISFFMGVLQKNNGNTWASNVCDLIFTILLFWHDNSIKIKTSRSKISNFMECLSFGSFFGNKDFQVVTNTIIRICKNLYMYPVKKDLLNKTAKKIYPPKWQQLFFFNKNKYIVIDKFIFYLQDKFIFYLQDKSMFLFTRQTHFS